MFLVPYIDKTFKAHNRLIAAPVYAMDERALGIVLVDCHPGHAAEMKVCLLAKEVMPLISPQPPPKAKRIGVDKTKMILLLASLQDEKYEDYIIYRTSSTSNEVS
jgi:hypothetical protein